MRKILLVSNYYSSYISAGTSKRSRDIKKGLSRLGWKCKVVTIKRKKLPISKEPDKIHITALESFSERYPILFFNNIKLYNLIKSSDIVHIIDHWSSLNIFSVLFCLISKTPYVYSPCGAINPEGKNILLKKIYNLFFLKLIFYYAAYFFVVTNKELKEIKDLSQGSVKAHIFPNGIWKQSNKKTNYKKNTKFSNFKIPSKYILFVGRLSIIKGPDILLEAFLKSNIKDKYSLIFAGPDENMKNKMFNYLKNSLYKKNILFLGSVNSQERDFLMKNAILTVIPSRKEAMSMVALESSSMGTPFLATKNCGLDDFQSNSSGFICNGNSESICNKLNYLLEDLNLLRKTGKNAENYILNSYTWESIIGEMDSFFIKLIDN